MYAPDDESERISTPDEIIRRRRACLADGDAETAAETTAALAAQITAGEPFDDVAADAVRAIAREYPEVAAAALPDLSEWFLDGLARVDPVYRGTPVLLALDLVRIDPTAADRISELLRAAEEPGFDEWAIEAFLITMGRANPGFLAEEIDLLTDPEYESQTIRPHRGWAIARAYRTDPAAFDPVVESLRNGLGGSGAERRAALERVGRLGLVAPDLVAPVVPDVVALANASPEADSGATADADAVASESRTAAIEALGLTAGTETVTNGRFGVPADGTDVDLLPAIVAALDSSAPDVVAAAATAYARAVARDGARRERAIDRLLDRLASADAETARTALLEALDRLSAGRTIGGSAADRLVAASASTRPVAEREAALPVLGRVDADEESRDAIDRALAAGTRADVKDVRREAIDGIEAALARRREASTVLVEALVAAADDDERFVREDAFEALAEARLTDSVRSALCDGIDDPDHAETAAETACKLGATGVVDVVVDRFVAAFESDPADPEPDGSAAEAEPDDPRAYSSDAHLTDVQTALVDAVVAVARELPSSLGPHVGRIVDVLTDEGTPRTHKIPRALAAVAAATPESVRPFAEALRGELDEDGRQPDAGFLLDALLAADAIGDAAIERAVTDYEAKALSPALARIAARRPLLALRAVSELEARLRVVDDHLAVSWWIHELDEIGVADPRVAPFTTDVCQLALEADDDWVRWDGAEALAEIAAAHSQWVRGYVPALVDALDDWNSHVPEWAVTALGRAGDDSVRGAVEPFLAHPQSGVRDAATTAVERFDGGAEKRAGAAADGLEDAIYGYRSTGRESNREAALEAAAGAEDRFLALCLVAARTGGDSGDSDDRARDRICDLLVAAADDADNDTHADDSDGASDSGSAVDLPAAFARHLGTDDPLERAIAAYAVGAVAEQEPADAAALAEALAALTGDGEPLVVRWAVRSLGRIGAAAPDAVAPHVPAIAARLDDEDAVTRAHIVQTLGRLVETDPDLLDGAVEPLVYRLADPVDVVRLGAVSALRFAPPERVATVPDAPTLLVDCLDDEEFIGGSCDAATVIAALAHEDPTVLTEHVDRLVAELDRMPIRAAVASIAAERPEALAGHEETLSDRQNRYHTRRALAAIHSEAYPERLREELTVHPESLRAELDTIVEFVVSAPRREHREAAIRAVRLAVRADPALATAFLTALTARLSASAASTRQGAAFAVAEAVSTLDRAAEPSDGPSVLETAVLPALLDRADDADWAVRSQSYRGIEAVLAGEDPDLDDYSRVVEVAFEGLGDEHGRVRRRAAAILGHLPAEVRESHDVERRVLALLDDADPLRRRGATLAVGRLGSIEGSAPAALEALEGGFDADDLWVRRNAIESVAEIAAGVGGDRIDRLLDSVPFSVRERIRTALSDTNPVVRAEACRCLGFVGTATDESALVARVDGESQPRVREAASAALERLRARVDAGEGG